MNFAVEFLRGLDLQHWLWLLFTKRLEGIQRSGIANRVPFHKDKPWLLPRTHRIRIRGSETLWWS